MIPQLLLYREWTIGIEDDKLPAGMFFLENRAGGFEFFISDIAKDAELRAIKDAAATVVGSGVAFVNGNGW